MARCISHLYIVYKIKVNERAWLRHGLVGALARAPAWVARAHCQPKIDSVSSVTLLSLFFSVYFMLYDSSLFRMLLMTYCKLRLSSGCRGLHCVYGGEQNSSGGLWLQEGNVPLADKHILILILSSL